MKFKALIPALVILVVIGCQDMDVTNPNNPSTASVQQDPDDLESLVATSFLTFWTRTQWTSGAVTATSLSGTFSGGFFCFGVVERGSEPRVPITTQPGAGNESHFFPWRDWNRSVAAVQTGLNALREGDVIIGTPENDRTPRTRAFGKFVQGISQGYLALTFDQSYVLTDDIVLGDLEFNLENVDDVKDLLRPYDEVMDQALANLDAALEIIDQNNVSIPSESPERWISGVSLSPEEFKQLIYTYKARFLAYLPRTRDERAAVEWQQVLDYLDRSYQRDFAPIGQPGIVQSLYKHRLARQRSDVPSDHVRPNYETIGVTDQSGQFQEWWATPWSDRTPFVMEPDDRRIVAENWQELDYWEGRGKYIGHHVANVWAASRGTAHRSYYYWHRTGRGNDWQSGPILSITEAEHDLLRAEALLWLGRPAEAIPYINKTRVANGELEPVTLDGAPVNADGNCTPRKYNGECGSLWDAMRWEKRIETMGTEGGFVAWFDRRGWQGLVEGTELHWPVPLEDQDLLSIQRYTMGGGLGDSAPPQDVERCPPAIGGLRGCP